MSQMTNTWWCVLCRLCCVVGQFPWLPGIRCGTTPAAATAPLGAALHCIRIPNACCAVAGRCRRCVAYPQLLDLLHLRLHRMREVLRRHMGEGEDVLVREELIGPVCCPLAACLVPACCPACLVCSVKPSNHHPRITAPCAVTRPQEYLCRRCGATYTSLDAIRLLDAASGAFHCEECRAELAPSVDAMGLGAGGGAASRQQLQQYAKQMLEKMEQQLRPLTGAHAEREPGLQQQQQLLRGWRPHSPRPGNHALAGSLSEAVAALPAHPARCCCTVLHCRATRQAERGAPSRLRLSAGECTPACCAKPCTGSAGCWRWPTSASQACRHAGACFAPALSTLLLLPLPAGLPCGARRTGTSGSTTCSGGGRRRRRRRGPRWQGGGWTKCARCAA